uniref:Enhancer of rudimentary homolog n=1 Tax=Paramoeba aestuarina TaxID=180227 RepID=A0A7S4JLB4_9EUKA|eukprot:CAMPEP_0201523020 /NCGR_PEP_ID=MMETSP0161_2-20130828/18698_1 /ASSEMBLY_ACC=CAM_ASM_000251 /TAXON_ID=180227 /ORGANISM="Neoparamoeba aestuarina, Strain SoJaBio B1-5/56/2" /LENGTH=103 /DNA_ID=CAMNT_0047922009 /DNA_START=21 /DNA_END=332 /DNA_ORIENTATION=+
MADRHTIILIQPHNNPGSRSYYDYESVPQAMDGVCNLFEEQLKKKNRNVPNITYGIQDLFNYLDGLHDMSALVYSNQTRMYEPFGRDWIKNSVHQHLKKYLQK